MYAREDISKNSPPLKRKRILLIQNGNKYRFFTNIFFKKASQDIPPHPPKPESYQPHPDGRQHR